MHLADAPTSEREPMATLEKQPIAPIEKQPISKVEKETKKPASDDIGAPVEDDGDEPQLQIRPGETFVAAKDPVEKQSLKRLREAIPDHCFQASWSKTLGYLSRDIFLYTTFVMLAWYGIPQISSAPLRWVLWITYGFANGLVYSGLWQIGHEMGHGSLLPSVQACNVFGFVLHSFCMTPFFAWRSTHHKHHRYNVHMEKDPNHIPARLGEDDCANKKLADQVAQGQIAEWTEDAPIAVLIRLIHVQIIAWPMHLLNTVSGGVTSTDYRSPEPAAWMPDWWKKSHYNPVGSNFRQDETPLIILSDIGIAATMTLLYKFASNYGWGMAFLLFIQPWMWLNNWIIVVTFLHHTHPEVPKYEAEAWTYWKSATSTIDRDFGFVGTFFFHNVVPYHVIHHFFPRIPFYHAKEATEYIKPILGKAYKRDDTNYIYAYWREYKDCRWLASDDAEKPEDRALWFVDGNGKLLSDKSAAPFNAVRNRFATKQD